jgi:hypothetical protein
MKARSGAQSQARATGLAVSSLRLAINFIAVRGSSA